MKKIIRLFALMSFALALISCDKGNDMHKRSISYSLEYWEIDGYENVNINIVDPDAYSRVYFLSITEEISDGLKSMSEKERVRYVLDNGKMISNKGELKIVEPLSIIPGVLWIVGEFISGGTTKAEIVSIKAAEWQDVCKGTWYFDTTRKNGIFDMFGFIEKKVRLQKKDNGSGKYPDYRIVSLYGIDRHLVFIPDETLIIRGSIAYHCHMQNTGLCYGPNKAIVSVMQDAEYSSAYYKLQHFVYIGSDYSIEAPLTYFTNEAGGVPEHNERFVPDK